MSPEESIESHINRFVAEHHAGTNPDVWSYWRLEHDPAVSGDYLAHLVEADIECRLKKSDPKMPWIDDYIRPDLWRHRKNVCRALTRFLFAKDDAKTARQLGVYELGGYRAVEVLGFGGFGTVLRACHAKDPSQAAIIKIAHRDPREASLVITQEAGALQAAKDVQSVPKFIGHGETSLGSKYLAMTYAEGETLLDWLGFGPEPRAVREVCRQLTGIVADIHKSRMCHGDLSLVNIVISGDITSPRVQLIDLGNSRCGFELIRLPVLTARYAAPELLLGDVFSSSERTDLWSLGLIIFELLVGHHPYGELPDGSTVADCKTWGQNLKSGAISLASGNLPSPVRSVLASCLVTDPDKRVQEISADRLLQVLSAEQDWNPTGATTAKLTPTVVSSDRSEAVRRSYLRWLVDCHERLEFRGIRYSKGGSITVELEQVYLALQADCTNPLERFAARQSVLTAVREAIQRGEYTEEQAEHAEWYYIAGSPLMPSMEDRDRLDPKKKEILNLAEAYFRESQLVILGDPGSGKTTLARWLTLVSAKAALKGNSGKPLNVPLYQVDPNVEDRKAIVSLGRVRLPILVRISEYAEERQRQAAAGKSPPSLLEFLGHHSWLRNKRPVWAEDHPLKGQSIDETDLNRLFRDALTAREALIVLDGLDEVPASSLRDEIIEEVDSFAKLWVRNQPAIVHGNLSGVPKFIVMQDTADIAGNRLIVTSRIAGYHARPLQGDLAHVTVEPMSPNAAARFVTNWMKAVHRETATDENRDQAEALADEESKRFLDALHHPRQRGARDLATNPLLCGLLATVFRQGKGNLPQQRVELYRQAVEMLFDIWINREGDDQTARLLRLELYDIMEPIAEHIHHHEATGLIPEDHLEQLALQFLAESRGENPLKPTAELREKVNQMIRVVREDVGLLAARGEGVWGFLHLTFQEYLAARALVKDPARSCDRIAAHLGDARWREPIRLALGHFNVQSSKAFGELVEGLLKQQTDLDDLLPQAALVIIGAMADLHELDASVAELLTNRLLSAYAVGGLRTFLPRRREVIEGAFKKLLDSASAPAVDSTLIHVLENAAQQCELGAAAAELLRRLDHFSPRLFQAMLAGLDADLPSWNWPIRAAMRIAMTPRVGESEPRVTLPRGVLPFRDGLLAEPKLVAQITSDFDWLRVILTLYGGVGDYESAAAIEEYHRFAAFLQQEDAFRNSYREAYVSRWGGHDGDFVYNMAVYLDTEGGRRQKRSAVAPEFHPRYICKDSAWTVDLLRELRQGHSPRQLLGMLRSAANQATPGKRSREARLLLWILADATNPLPATCNVVGEDFQGELRRLLADLSDAVTRSGPTIKSALSALSGVLEPRSWWTLFEASMTTVLAHGCLPMNSLLDLRKILPVSLHPLLIGEMLAIHGRGWGDDAVYNAAVFTDTAKVDPPELVAAHLALPLAVHQLWKWFQFNWPTVSIPPTSHEGDPIPVSVLTNTAMIPPQLGFMRGWIFRDVLKPIILRDAQILPEVLACSLGDSGERASREELFAAFAPELLTHADPATEIYRRSGNLADPFYRARALLRLAEHWPQKRSELIAEARGAVGLIEDPAWGEQLYEWLASVGSGPEADADWEMAHACAIQISDRDTCGRALGRLGLIAAPGKRAACFHAALDSAKRIPDEFARGTTLRLLQRAFGGVAGLDVPFKDAIATIQDPVLAAWTAENWNTVFQRLLPKLRTEVDHREVWAILSVVTQAESDLNTKPTKPEDLWINLAESPSDATLQLLIERSASRLLELTPLAAQCLERLLYAGQTAIAETIFPRLRASSAEVVPFLERQLNSNSPKIAALSALFLTEMKGLGSVAPSGLIDSLVSADDLTANRAGEQLYGGPQEPIHRAALIGNEGLNILFQSACDPGERLRTCNSMSWFCERLNYDDVRQISDWAATLNADPRSAVANWALSRIHFLEPPVWSELLKQLATGTTEVRKAILRSAAHLAKFGRLADGRWEALREVMCGLQDSALELNDNLTFTSDNLCGIVIDTLITSSESEIDGPLVATARQLLWGRHGFDWMSVFRLEPPESGLAYLKAIGESFYRTVSGPERWANAASAAQPGLQHRGFMELLCEWIVGALTESVEDPDPFFSINDERSQLIELLAGAAMHAPERFLRCPARERLRSLLLAVAVRHRVSVARADSIRLLGYMRNLSSDVLPSLRSALADAFPVREAAIDAVSLFRRMDPDVLPIIKSWLTDESGLIAYATARLLTSIGRHIQVVGKVDRAATGLRRDIVKMLADAVRHPFSRRPLDFGSNTTPTPEVPRLCDFFFDCMLKVVGYDERATI